MTLAAVQPFYHAIRISVLLFCWRVFFLLHCQRGMDRLEHRDAYYGRPET